MQDIDSILKLSSESLLNSSRTSKLDAEVLLSNVLKKNIAELIIDKSTKINQDEFISYKKLIKRRELGEPIAYILNIKEFWKNTFFVDQNVLIPRPDTEIIVEETLKLLNNDKKKFVLDVGTGSGSIIISLANERPNLIGTAIDISKKALKVAKINAKMPQLLNRIKFYNSSVDNFFKGKYDLIVSNPPYIRNLELKYLDRDIIGFEPLVSLSGGLDGSFVLNKVIKKSSSLLKIGGKLVLEIGFDQKYKVMSLLKKKRFFINKVVKDYANKDRCIIATKI